MSAITLVEACKRVPFYIGQVPVVEIASPSKEGMGGVTLNNFWVALAPVDPKDGRRYELNLETGYWQQVITTYGETRGFFQPWPPEASEPPKPEVK